MCLVVSKPHVNTAAPLNLHAYPASTMTADFSSAGYGGRPRGNPRQNARSSNPNEFPEPTTESGAGRPRLNLAPRTVAAAVGAKTTSTKSVSNANELPGPAAESRSGRPPPKLAPQAMTAAAGAKATSTMSVFNPNEFPEPTTENRAGRPPLKLAPRTVAAAVGEKAASMKNDPFGGAKPRDESAILRAREEEQKKVGGALPCDC